MNTTSADEEQARALANTYDVVVVGSGAGGLSAALSASIAGLRPIVLEKADKFGGTTARSGGGAWLPGNPLAAESGIEDPVGQARQYIELIAGERFDAERVDAFLDNAGAMVDTFAKHSEVELMVAMGNQDYHPEIAGARCGGRTCFPLPYDGGRLGMKLDGMRTALPELTFAGMNIGSVSDVAHFSRGIRSIRSTVYILGRLVRHMIDVLRHGRATKLTNGQALIARFAKSLFDRGVAITLDTTVTKLALKDGRVVGVHTTGKHGSQTYYAKRGVVLACGGFPADDVRRQATYPTDASVENFATPAPQENSGDGLRLAEEVGAQTSVAIKDGASWCPMSELTRRDGTNGVHPHFMDRQKPGVIAVNQLGQRFCNEATSYHEFVTHMFRHCVVGDSVSAYLIADHRSLRRYGLGNVRPFPIPMSWHLKSGYLIRERSLTALSERLGFPESSLESAVAAFNKAAALGKDPQFQRGESAYGRYLGDPDHLPNPCIGPLEKPPFYAIKIVPGEIGTNFGLVTNADANVLNTNGRAIDGLYAVGNDMLCIFDGDYIGGGATLGPAMTFGYIVGKHLAEHPSSDNRE